MTFYNEIDNGYMISLVNAFHFFFLVAKMVCLVGGSYTKEFHSAEVFRLSMTKPSFTSMGLIS